MFGISGSSSSLETSIAPKSSHDGSLSLSFWTSSSKSITRRRLVRRCGVPDEGLRLAAAWPVFFRAAGMKSCKESREKSGSKEIEINVRRRHSKSFNDSEYGDVQCLRTRSGSITASQQGRRLHKVPL